jgi:GGDEF domain-containing protein
MSLATETAERLRRDLHEVAIAGGRALSGSFSVVEIQADERLADAFERADAGLLAAKRAGRDTVMSRHAAHPSTAGPHARNTDPVAS